MSSALVPSFTKISCRPPAAPPVTAVGVVGLGNMGWRMAHNLAKGGFSLVVYDLDTGRSRRFAAEHGSTAAESPRDFTEVAVVLTMPPDGDAVRDAVIEWQGGIASALAPGSVLLDMGVVDWAQLSSPGM
jgi:3-hydroxyisobutyrate dehydrogenase